MTYDIIFEMRYKIIMIIYYIIVYPFLAHYDIEKKR
jgi:hypothetical protein